MGGKSSKQDSESLRLAMEKIKSFLAQQDLTLSMMFNVMDTNADQSLQRSEFSHKIKAMHIDLTDKEIEALF